MTTPKWCRAHERTAARWPEASSSLALTVFKTAFLAPMNGGSVRFLSLGPGQSTHVRPSEGRYDSRVRANSAALGCCLDQRPRQRRLGGRPFERIAGGQL